jgi:hypothetical protein
MPHVCPAGKGKERFPRGFSVDALEGRRVDGWFARRTGRPTPVWDASAHIRLHACTRRLGADHLTIDD